MLSLPCNSSFNEYRADSSIGQSSRLLSGRLAVRSRLGPFHLRLFVSATKPARTVAHPMEDSRRRAQLTCCRCEDHMTTMQMPIDVAQPPPAVSFRKSQSKWAVPHQHLPAVAMIVLLVLLAIFTLW